LNRLKVIILLGTFVILYFVSLLSFVLDIDKKYIIKNHSNNIVVLTGNAQRLVSGLNLMSNNDKSRMLITGVAKGVKHFDIIKNKNINKNRVELGYKAQNTQGNAIETSVWMKKYNINDIILVTDDWHMQRALLLFNGIISNIQITPYAIKSINFKIKDYLQFDNRIFFIHQEHIKYILSHIQVIYFWLIN
tara:strand:- start:44 stop:616 length:573 start_codon:yes stop_codon:yes gene_type:complete